MVTKPSLVGSLGCSLILLFASTSSAQSSVYLGGAGFAEMKTFNETEFSLDPEGEDAADLDAPTAGGGLRVGTFLHPKWSIELSVDTGAKSTGTPSLYPYILSAASGLRAPDLRQSVGFLSVSTVVGYHPAARGRLRPGFLGGIAFVTTTYKSQYPNYYYAVTTQLLTLTSSLSSVIPTILPPPGTVVQTVTTTDHTTAATLGFETAIDLGGHLSVVPEVRVLAFTAGPVGGTFLVRPGVGARWRF